MFVINDIQISFAKENMYSHIFTYCHVFLWIKNMAHKKFLALDVQALQNISNVAIRRHLPNIQIPKYFCELNYVGNSTGRKHQKHLKVIAKVND